jgi:hypothetical protein
LVKDKGDEGALDKAPCLILKLEAVKAAATGLWPHGNMVTRDLSAARLGELYAGSEGTSVILEEIVSRNVLRRAV